MLKKHRLPKNYHKELNLDFFGMFDLVDQLTYRKSEKKIREEINNCLTALNQTETKQAEYSARLCALSISLFLRNGGGSLACLLNGIRSQTEEWRKKK